MYLCYVLARRAQQLHGGRFAGGGSYFQQVSACTYGQFAVRTVPSSKLQRTCSTGDKERRVRKSSFLFSAFYYCNPSQIDRRCSCAWKRWMLMAAVKRSDGLQCRQTCRRYAALAIQCLLYIGCFCACYLHINSIRPSCLGISRRNNMCLLFWEWDVFGRKNSGQTISCEMRWAGLSSCI